MDKSSAQVPSCKTVLKLNIRDLKNAIFFLFGFRNAKPIFKITHALQIWICSRDYSAKLEYSGLPSSKQPAPRQIQMPFP